MEITNNQNAESFVVRELTEKSNGNAKYFLLSNGNIRAEFYASECAETISAEETNADKLPAAVKATAAAADSQTLNLGVTVYGFTADLTTPLSGNNTYTMYAPNITRNASAFLVKGNRTAMSRVAFAQVGGSVPQGIDIQSCKLYLCTGSTAPDNLFYSYANIAGNPITVNSVSFSTTPSGLFSYSLGEDNRYWATIDVAATAGASLNRGFCLLPYSSAMMAVSVCSSVAEQSVRPKLVVEYTLPVDASHEDIADVAANLQYAAVEEKEQSYVEGGAGNAGEYGVNVRTGRLFFDKQLFSLGGNKMPASFELCYNKANADTRKINTDNSTAKTFNLATHMPKGFKLNCQQYVFPSGNDYVYVDGAYNYHTFALAQNATDVYFDTAGTGLLLYVKTDGFEIKDNTFNRMTFNAKGLLISVEKTFKNATLSMTNAYDAEDADKLVSVTDGMGRVTQFAYAGRTVTVTKPDGNTLTMTMNDDWRLAGLSESDGTSNSYAYYADGVLESAENSAGEKAVFTFDAQGRVAGVKNKVKGSTVGNTLFDYTLSYLTKTVTYRYTDDEDATDKIRYVYEFDGDGKTVRTYEALDDSFNSYGNIQFRSESEFEHFVQTNTGTPMLSGMFETAGEIYNSKVVDEFQTTAYSVNSLSELPKTKSGEHYVLSATANLAGTNAGEVYKIELVEAGTTERVIKTLEFTAGENRPQYRAISFTVPDDIGQAGFKLVVQGGSASFNNVKLTKTLKPKTYDCTNMGKNVIDNVCGQKWSSLTGNMSVEYTPTASSAVVELNNIKFLAEDFEVNKKNANDSTAGFDVWYNGLKNCIHNAHNVKFFTGSTKYTFNCVEFARVTFENGRAIIDKTVYSPETGVYARAVRNVIENYDGGSDSYLIEQYTDLDEHMFAVRKKGFNDMITEYSYDDLGNLTSEKTYDYWSPDTFFKTEYVYEQNGGFLKSVTTHDLSPAVTVQYSNTLSTGNVSEVTSPRGQTTSSVYAANNVQLTEISSTVDGTKNKNGFSYNSGRLASASNDGVSYQFYYNSYNEVSSVYAGGSKLLEKTYEHTPQKDVVVTKHANGNEVRKTYDKYERLVKVEERLSASDEFEQKTVYIYSDNDVSNIVDPFDQNLTISADSPLRIVLDKEKGTRYNYDNSGRVAETDGYRVWYDESNRLYMRDVSTPFGVVNSSIFYAGELLYPDEPDRVLGSGAGRYTENYNLDSQKRVSRIDVDMTSAVSSPRKTCSLKREITYNDSDAEEGNKKYASELVKSIYVRDGKKDENEPALSVYTLEYDGDGNITKHTYSKPGIAIALGTVTSSTYEYDKLNRLTRENNERLGKTWTYSYDAGGNITERKEYAYTTAEQLDNETATATKEYVYRTSGWKDQLLSYDGESIVYDASGNPTTYRGATLGFEAGRRLKSYKKAGDANAYEFTFDYRGVRNSKKTKDADGHDKTWSFYYDEDGKLWGETKSEKVLQGNFGIKLWTDRITKIGFFHLNSGLAGFTLSRQTGIADAVKADYIYRKNALGDIDGIFDTDMNLIGEYVYDAWGNCTIEATGADNIEIMETNPFRYRGYYWDKELNLYYLQTRYYDPETGRFINADGIEYALEQYKNINALNLYSYCNNNPIMGIDPEGTKSKFWGWLLTAFVAVVATAAIVVGTVVTGGLVSAVLVGAGVGALTSMGSSVIAQGGFKDADPWQVAKSGAIGAVIGAASGAASWAIGTIGQAIGQHLGYAFSSMRHISSGVKLGSVFGVDLMMSTGKIAGSVIGGIAGGTFMNYHANLLFGTKLNFEEAMNQGIGGEISSWLIGIFKWLVK
mgnify:FL=1